MLKLVSRIAAFLLLFGWAGSALAASGTAVGVDPDAEARGDTTRTLVVGADVFIGDRIVTDSRGLVQILFDDKTKLVVGPRSALLIDDYLLREDGSAGKFAVTTLSGTFRFITGNSNKKNYVITTPTGQIGVRGTAFDLYVTNAVTYGLRLAGTMIGCPENDPRDCDTMGGKCEIGALRSGEMDVLGTFRDLDGDEQRQARKWFRLAASQGGLLRPFRISGAESCLKGSSRPNVEVEIQPFDSLSDGPPIRPRTDGKGDSLGDTILY
jgi:hypothetical protein